MPFKAGVEVRTGYMRISKKAKSIMLKTSIALCVFVGILASIPNLVSERAELYWIATIPLGIIADFDVYWISAGCPLWWLNKGILFLYMGAWD